LVEAMGGDVTYRPPAGGADGGFVVRLQRAR
jgi:hypothetical protein